MRPSPTDSLSGEEQHDGAELRAVLASSGAAGVDGEVRRKEADREELGTEELGFGKKRESREQGAGRHGSMGGLSFVGWTALA